MKIIINEQNGDVNCLVKDCEPDGVYSLPLSELNAERRAKALRIIKCVAGTIKPE